MTAALLRSACCEAAAASLQRIVPCTQLAHQPSAAYFIIEAVLSCTDAGNHREADYCASGRLGAPVNFTSATCAVPVAVPAKSCSGAAHPQHENTAPASMPMRVCQQSTSLTAVDTHPNNCVIASRSVSYPSQRHRAMAGLLRPAAYDDDPMFDCRREKQYEKQAGKGNEGDACSSLEAIYQCK